MFITSSSSGVNICQIKFIKLPQRVNDERTTNDIQRFAKENDTKAKQNMKTYAD